ncbi:hypothetical protein Tco_0407355 [Tanacetum coccineum]
MPANQEHVHLAWPLWSDLKVIRTHGKFGSLMTTTVVNNSLFMTFFEKQEGTRLNFMDWYHNLWIVLSIEDKLPFLEQPIPAMPVPLVGQVLPLDVLNTQIAWVKASKEIAGLMLLTMNLGAYDMLKELKTLYAQHADQELL